MSRLTIDQLAKAIGVTRQAVSAWENGHTTPTEDNLAALRSLLGASFESSADAMFATLQRLHGRSEELAALSRYLVMRQDELSAELAAATQQPYAADDAAAIAAADAPLRPSARADAPPTGKRSAARG